jgi:hypothetical protein
MNWIRIAVGITRDPRIIALSEAVGVSVPTTTGHVVGILTALPEGSDNGDLTNVSDATIEQWAMWRGKRGVFAAAFRAQLCDAQGVVRAWEKHNGAEIRRAKAAATRAKAWRDERKENALRMRTQCVANAERTALRDETRRNVTTEQISVVSEISALSTHPDKAPIAGLSPTRQPALDFAPEEPPPKPRKAKPAAAKPDARWPDWPKAERDALHAQWQAAIGAVHYGQWIGHVGELFGGQVLVGATRDDIARAYRSYLSSVQAGGAGTRFASPAQFARLAGALVQAWRDFRDDPPGRVAAVDRIVHGRAA